MDTKLWGELKPKSPIITKEQREKILNLPPTRDAASQTRHHKEIDFKKISSSDIMVDPVLLHSSNLRTYLEVAESSVENVKKKLKNAATGKERQYLLSYLKPLPNVPDYPLKDRKLALKYKNSALKLANIKLCNVSIRMMLKKNISAILIHVGYDETSQICLTHLAGMLDNYLKVMLNILRKHCDIKEFGNRDDCMFPLEETLHEMGIDGLKELNEFYIEDVIKVRDAWLSKCIRSYENYQALAIGGDKETNDEFTETTMSSTLNLPSANFELEKKVNSTSELSHSDMDEDEHFSFIHNELIF